MTIPTVTRDDVFLAVLAMDTYHRGVNSGLGTGNDGLGSAINTKIGTAEIKAYEGTQDSSIGFVAFRYSWNGNNVYAYRGTDRGFNDFSATGDIQNGYILGAGLPNAAQALAAVEFFTDHGAA